MSRSLNLYFISNSDLPQKPIESPQRKQSISQSMASKKTVNGIQKSTELMEKLKNPRKNSRLMVQEDVVSLNSQALDESKGSNPKKKLMDAIQRRMSHKNANKMDSSLLTPHTKESPPYQK